MNKLSFFKIIFDDKIKKKQIQTNKETKLKTKEEEREKHLIK